MLPQQSGESPWRVPAIQTITSILVITGTALVPADDGHGCSGVPSFFPGFSEEPAGSMINRVESTHDSLANIEIVTTDPATGLAVGRRYRRVPELGALVIESTLTNTSRATVTTRDVALIRWDIRIADSQSGLRYRELTYRNDTWYGSTYWTGPDWTRVGKDWHHPGENTPSVRRFTAPRDGRVAISGRVYKADTNAGGGDGVRLFIRHGFRDVWQAEINGNDANGVEPKITIDVTRGDAIRFVVHKRGHIICDTTHWDPVIAYVDRGGQGERFQASAAFSTSNQGQGGWSYEMDTIPQAEQTLPRLHGYGPDMTVTEWAPGLGSPVRLTDRDALSLFVLADGPDKSGIALAMNSTAPWQLGATLNQDGRLRLELNAAPGQDGCTLKPGEKTFLPRLVVRPYRGGWLMGTAALQPLLSKENANLGLTELKNRLASAFRSITATLDANLKAREGESSCPTPELDLWTMAQLDWRKQDRLVESSAAYAPAIQNQIDRTRRLLADIRSIDTADSGASAPSLEAWARQLDRLSTLANRPGLSLDQQRSTYLRVRWLKRQIALSNPLLRFGEMLFCKRVPTSYSHLVMQYYGWRARPGGGIFVLEKPGYSLAARDILGGTLADGNVLEPRLSYDGKRIVFSFVRCPDKVYDYNQLANDVDEGFYHIFEVNVDGTGLRQLTRGPYDDLMPTYLPDGGIAFSSTRRRGYARCFGPQFSRRWHVYTLHRMDADGGNIRTLSYHDTNEWFPSVSHTGQILYSRWDYIDRDAVTHQNIWATRPDGTNPFAVWGNAVATPHCSFQLQPIPNSSKIIFTASAHHSITAGSIAIVDPTVDNNAHRAVTRITPEIPFPEAEGMNIPEYYEAPWPLSEKYYLVGYSPKPLIWEPGANDRDALGIYLLDAAGNRELIYRDPDIGSTNPRPLTPTPKPPVLQSMLASDAPPTGEMVLMDVYQGLTGISRGSVKSLRIVQIFPKTTNVAGSPPIGMAAEENARAVLGTVPVESDGSSRFTVPACKPILFQALDKDGFALQTMRTVTYVQPGERVSCVGCHENRMTAAVRRAAVAARRPPSAIEPGPFDGRPFSYVRVVQPVLDKHCVKCHGGDTPKKGITLTGLPDRGYTKSYWSLCSDRNFWGEGTNPKNAAEALVPRFGGRNQIQVTPPGGMYGALGSRLIKMLRKGHNDVELDADELRRLAMWIDLNAIFYGVNLPDDQAKQLRGEVVAMPDIQ